MLIENGADVNAAFIDEHRRPRSTGPRTVDDARAFDALVDRGAEIEACDGVIGGSTPLADAVAFGQWQTARRLIERGAKTTLWQAAALGLMNRVEKSFESESPPRAPEITNAFWCACHGGQMVAAQYLLERALT